MISTAALKLGGFALAHAANIVSDLTPPNLLVPFALCEDQAGAKTLNIFEAATQEQAVARGKAFMASLPGAFQRCAFARDGIWRGQDGSGMDALTVTFWERGQESELTISQRYKSPGRSAFGLIGEAIVIEDGNVLEGVAAESVTRGFLAGVADYPDGQARWRRWGGQPALPTSSRGDSI